MSVPRDPAPQRVDGWAVLALLGVLALVPAAARAALEASPPPATRGLPCGGLLGGEKLDLSTASSAELELLPGIGPVAAERLVAARPLVGWEQVAAVRGIGATRAKRLSAYAVLKRPSPPLEPPCR